MTYLNIIKKDILKVFQNRSDSANQLIKKAWEFAEEAHGTQRRLSGEPYLCHPAIVAYHLAEVGMDKSTVAAGLLHDTLEDTETTYQELKETFGKEVADLVKGVTRIGGLKYDKKRQQAGDLRNLFVAAAQDIRVIIIKLFDRLHNLETLEYHNRARQKRKAIESLEIYAPIAYRLGMSFLRIKIEDLAFSNLYPNKYKKVAEFREKRSKEIEEGVTGVFNSIKKELKQNKINFRAEIRKKGVYDLFKKIKRAEGKNLKFIYDITPIRIVVKDVPSCYQTMGIVHTKFYPFPSKIKDFISSPKPSGYQAIHTSVFTGKGEVVEIQIMTEDMDSYTRIGVACNLVSRDNDSTFFSFFKQINRSSDKKNSQEFGGTPDWFRDMVNNQKEMKNTDEFFSNLNKDFFSYRIIVFTPKGDVVNLPNDSSPIDFAYYIHSDLGNHIKAVEIDGQKASLSTKLENGNIVNIITSPSVRPSSEWLNYVKTITAKKEIKHFLRKN